MYHIRPYNEKDRSRIEYICAPEEGPIREASLNCFCRYYIEREPESCFVCADDNDVAQGYILCAKDFSHWAETIDSVYGQRDPISSAIAFATIENLRPFAERYPAHLHIDLDPSCQRQGLGTRLISTLEEHLKENGITGLMLDVAIENTDAQRFYIRNGFSLLSVGLHSWQMGKELR